MKIEIDNNLSDEEMREIRAFVKTNMDEWHVEIGDMADRLYRVMPTNPTPEQQDIMDIFMNEEA